MYSIAYRHKDGTDFQGKPWLVGLFDDLGECKRIAREMVGQSYQDVTAFSVNKDTEEEISWEYVKQNKLECFTEKTE